MEEIAAAKVADKSVERVTDDENCTRDVHSFSCTTASSDRKAILESIRARNSSVDSRSQCLRLLEAIGRLGSVTTFEASRYLDIYHPPARKRDLVRQGFAIRTGWRIERTESGRAHRVGEYLVRNAPDGEIAAPVQQEFWSRAQDEWLEI
ncbi:helix-turn-helix domain-containing protein [Paraburkholderia sp. GAS42]|uniref:helix-turn-helix domain-containing protein n=1 Tax=Paraburkholderia sp. GAS42 TaxID=3035135 RepID=UPI003D1B08A1